VSQVAVYPILMLPFGSHFLFCRHYIDQNNIIIVIVGTISDSVRQSIIQLLNSATWYVERCWIQHSLV